MSRFYPLILLLIGLSIAFGVRYDRNSRLNEARAVKFGSTSLIIPEKVQLDALIETLSEQEVYFDEDHLKWAAKLSGWRNFQKGHYSFDDAVTYSLLLNKLGRGLQDPVRFNLRKGSTPGRIAKDLGKAFQSDSAAFAKVLLDSTLLEEQVTNATFFSKMLPATYEFYWDTDPKTIISRIHQVFDQKTKNLLDQIAETKQVMSLEDAIIMASIVEWEAARDDEKPRIAGLYYNRLKRGMRLQADPTVNFALKERRRLYYEDYRIKHPFNTYRIKGLPPAPINNPSLSSIKAALSPEKHDYLYMVAEPGATGYHVFTKSYAAHKRESRKWTKWLREQYRIKEQKEQEALLVE